MADYSSINVLSTYNDDDIKYPVILSIPHSGTVFPEEFLSQTNLSIEELRTSEDPYVEELLAPMIEKGVCAIKLNIARAVIDVNRDKIEIDEQMFFDYPQDELSINSRRLRFGFGVIHRINSENKEIYKDKISYQDALSRIENIYDVYHHKLNELIERTVKKFGTCTILDVHSMPAKVCNVMMEEKPVDFCISTLFEQSAPKEVWQKLGDELGIFNYRVEYNRPYSGAYTTFHYCQPKEKIYTMQLEINRSLYINEQTLEKKPSFINLKTHLSHSISSLLSINL